MNTGDAVRFKNGFVFKGYVGVVVQYQKRKELPDHVQVYVPSHPERQWAWVPYYDLEML